MPTNASRARKALTEVPVKDPKPKETDFLSLGITVLNLATYGRTHGGMAKGRIYHIKGRQSAGKTMMAKGIQAEAACNPHFADYLLIYNDLERAADLIDTSKFFGKLLANRMIPPKKDKSGFPIYANDLSESYKWIGELLDKGKKFIWIEDSLDSSSGHGETAMTDNKAKMHSQTLRKFLGPLMETGSILILLSQARMNLRSSFGGDITAGGLALQHYPSLSIQLSKVKTYTRPYKDKKFPVGVRVQARVTKNRITGVDRTVHFPLYYASGIDDVGACIDYLVDYSHWDKTKGIITAPEFNFEGSEKLLIKHIEEGDLQRELQVLTGKVWRYIDDATKVQRKSRYS